MPTVAEIVHEFDQVNGNKCVCIGSMLYFANGARREVNPYGALYDAPENDFRRFKIIEAYQEVHLKEAVEAFATARGDYMSMAQSNAACGAEAPDLEEAEDTLTQLMQKVRIWQRRLRDTRAKIATTPEARRKLRDEEDYADNLAANEEFMNAIREFKL